MLRRCRKHPHLDIYVETSMYYHANLEQQVLELEVELCNPKTKHNNQIMILEE